MYLFAQRDGEYQIKLLTILFEAFIYQINPDSLVESGLQRIKALLPDAKDDRIEVKQ